MLRAASSAGKKRKQPGVPAELRDGCPFHRDDADAQELSEFGHEMERDGRQPEAERCYAQAIRTHPRTAVGWFDLAIARQYSHQAAALKYYRHGLSLLPSAYHYNQFGIIMRAREKHDEAAHLFRSARIDADGMTTAMRWAYDGAGQIIDPHSAIGLAAAREAEIDADVPVVTLATAHPAKFRDAVERATGVRPPLPGRVGDLFAREESYAKLPGTFEAVTAYVAERATPRG